MIKKYHTTHPGNLKIRGIAILFFMALWFNALSQNVPEEVALSFRKGDAKALSEHLHRSLEISIDEQTHTVSRNQAVRILQDFFDDHPPSAFEVSYEGIKTEAKYSLCNYHSKREKYHINLYFIEEKENKYIYSISIEKL